MVARTFWNKGLRRRAGNTGKLFPDSSLKKSSDNRKVLKFLHFTSSRCQLGPALSCHLPSPMGCFSHLFLRGSKEVSHISSAHLLCTQEPQGTENLESPHVQQPCREAWVCVWAPASAPLVQLWPQGAGTALGSPFTCSLSSLNSPHPPPSYPFSHFFSRHAHSLSPLSLSLTYSPIFIGCIKIQWKSQWALESGQIQMKAWLCGVGQVAYLAKLQRSRLFSCWSCCEG